jgi:hypothetical protein
MVGPSHAEDKRYLASEMLTPDPPRVTASLGSARVTLLRSAKAGRSILAIAIAIAIAIDQSRS